MPTIIELSAMVVFLGIALPLTGITVSLLTYLFIMKYVSKKGNRRPTNY